VLLEVIAQELRGTRLVPRRVDRVQAEERLEELDDPRAMRAHRYFGSHTTSFSPRAAEHTSGVSDLFADAAEGRLADVAPLAQRLRPSSLDDFVGQDQVVGEGSALRLAIAEDRVASAIFYGPPGTGKTTLARIVAATTGAAFEELSAVSASVADVRAILQRARDRLGGSGQRTILFLDEIHRFNKAQQDAMLPAVETGLVTLIGATTENPYFEVNSALLSRTQIYELQPLTSDDLAVVVRKGTARLEAELTDELVEKISHRAGGDARAALNILELAHQSARAEGVAVEERHVDDAARKRPLVYDKGGDAHYDFTSAFIKSIRASDPDATLFYLSAMLEGGEDPRYVARRMIVHASEDIGNADPRALLVAVAAAHALEHVGLPEAQLNLAQAAIYLARAPKSNAVLKALGAAQADVKELGALRPPKSLRDAHYFGAKKLGHGKGYVYPPDDPAGYETDYLPDELKGKTYYEPSGNGEETTTRPQQEEVEPPASAR
jgi:putative ATPase